MAKDSKKEKAAGAYGIEHMAKHLGVQPATARVILRNNKIKKDGRSYSWSSKTEMEKVAKGLRSDSAPAKKASAKVKPKIKAKKAKAEDQAAA